MQQFEAQNGHLPPAYEVRNGYKRSWRVLLLPFVERNDLYKAYRFDEPWDGPNNSKLGLTIPDVYRCPSDSKSKPYEASYFVMTGHQMPFYRDQTITSQQITDGLTNTILVVEAAGTGIHWMEPRDLDIADVGDAFKPNAGVAISSYHGSGANVSFADSRTIFLHETNSPTVLKALFTHAGGETLPPDAP